MIVPKINGIRWDVKHNGNDLSIQWFAPREGWNTVLNLVRLISGRRFDPATKRWTIPATIENIEWLKRAGWKGGNLEPIQDNKPTIDTNIAKIPRQYREYASAPERVPTYNIEEKQKEIINNFVLNENKDLIPGLRDYQVDFIKFAAYRNGRVMLSDDMGTGKTLQSLAWLAYNRSFPALIVVNSPTKLQWKQEYKRWLKLVAGCPTRAIVLKGQTPYNIESGVTCIINWDILSYWQSKLSKMGFRCLIGDEAQAIGNPTSKRAKAFRKLAKVIPEVIVMSGTPARSRPAQFWTMMSCVDEKLFPDYQAYLWRYCNPSYTPFGWKFDGAKNTKELHSLLTMISLRRTKDEVMKFLPPKTVNVIPLEVDESGVKNLAAEMDSIVALSSKQEQRERVAELIRSAYVLKEKSLIEWVKNFLDTSNEKLLLFGWHRDVVEMLFDSLQDYNPALIYGGTNLQEREVQKKKFLENDSCRVIIGNIQSLGTGVDGLQKVCCNVAFAEMSYTPTDMNQATDRLHRGGQDRPVNVFYLIAPGTVDSDIMESLDERSKMLAGVLDGKEVAQCDLLEEILARNGANNDT